MRRVLDGPQSGQMIAFIQCLQKAIRKISMVSCFEEHPDNIIKTEGQDRKIPDFI